MTQASTNDLTIRKAAATDRTALASLNVEVQRLHATNRPEDFKPASVEALAPSLGELLENPSATVWVAEYDAAPIGYVVVRVRDRAESAFCTAQRWWELDNVCVAAEHRRSGVFRALLQKVLAEAGARGIGSLELQTWHSTSRLRTPFVVWGLFQRRSGTSCGSSRAAVGTDGHSRGVGEGRAGR